MHLQTQIAAPHRIQKIKTNGEIGTETRFHRSAQQFLRLLEYQIICRHFKTYAVNKQ